MTLAAWVELITLVLKFPQTVLDVVRLLQKTPEEKHQDVVKAIQDEAAKFDQTGRPTWG